MSVPARELSSTIMIVMGTLARPARVAGSPAPVCRYTATTKPFSARAPYANAVAMLPYEKLRTRNMSSGRIGCGALRCRSRKSANSRMPPPRVTQISGESHPRRGCSISANTVDPRPTVHSVAPSQSILAPGRRSSR